MRNDNYVSSYLSDISQTISFIDKLNLEVAIEIIRTAWLQDRQVIVFGNGGSALTALHYVTDWSKAIPQITGRRFRGRSLIDNVGLFSAFGNDVAYDDVFVEQLKNIMQPDDLVVAISGSGNSENVLRAVAYAQENGGSTLAIVGFDGGRLIQIADAAFLIPKDDMQICEDLHLMFGHIVLRALTADAVLQVNAQ